MRAIKPEAVKPSKPKTLLSGPAKSHKSRFALQFPSTYYIDTESGITQQHYQDDLKQAGGVYMGPEQGSQDFTSVLDEIKWLHSNKHEFKTLVIDSMSKLANIGFAAEEARMTDAGQSIEYGAHKKPTMRQIRRLVGLINQIDMNVLLICHSKDKWVGKGKDRSVDGTTYDGWEKLEYELDLWIETKLLGSKASGTVRASRYKQFPMGNTLPLEYATFAQIYGKDIMEKVAEPIVPVSKDRLQEITNLLTLLRVSEEELDKWLKKLQAEELEDLTRENAEKLFGFLNDKIKGVK